MDRSPYGCGGTFIILCVLFIAWVVDGCSTACNPKESGKQPEPQKTSGKVPEKLPEKDIIQIDTAIKYN